MPQNPQDKLMPHPVHRNGELATKSARRLSSCVFAELQVTTNYTFLTGASHPEEYVIRAAELGYYGLAITDTNTLAGVVRMHVAARDAGLKLAVGCRLVFAVEDMPNVLVYPGDRTAYGRLCQILTRGKLRTTKGSCHLTLSDLLENHEGLCAVVVPPVTLNDGSLLTSIRALKDTFGVERLSIAASCCYGSNDRSRLREVANLARFVGVPLVASNDVHYHIADRKPLHDVLTCIRYGCTLQEAGLRLKPNAEQHLKSPEEMYRLFAAYPQAMARSLEIINIASSFSLDELRYEYPHETCPPDKSPMQHLTDLTWKGAALRYPEGMGEDTRTQIEHELDLIADLNYPHYFLTVHDIVSFARSQEILCQGRGAAANSAVCFCLGLTEVDPARIPLLFERFVSRERDEPPDIDIDFEHECREEVIQYIYRKYGRHRAALTAEVITYRAKSAIREVGKALGLSLDCVDRLAKNREWFDREEPKADELRQLGLNPNDPTIKWLGILVSQILGFPRHLSQHVGGFVLTERPLSETVPIENAAMSGRTVIEWDKDDIEALGMLKVDVLGLGMLTCIRKCFELVERQYEQPLSIYRIMHEFADDPDVYAMIQRADTVGVFQIESRAQMSMLPRLRPENFYDLVIEVAIVRPGPIQGGMVHPYLRRRTKKEEVTYPSEAIREVLERTLGVPLFQEQVMALAVRAAGFTPGESDELRRSMAAWKRKGHMIKTFHDKMVNGMLANGYELEFAERCFQQVQGFGDYGFPESHAASFAILVYVSCWLKHHYPAAFAAALINSQPMGFYAPAQIVRDVKEHGVEVRAIDVNASEWNCTLEHGSEQDSLMLRLGTRLVKGLSEVDAQYIDQSRNEHGTFRSIDAVRRRSGATAGAMKRLASADAFQSLGLDRQQALWQVRSLRDDPLPLFDDAFVVDETAPLPSVPMSHKVLHDYASTTLSLKAHPLSFLRRRLREQRVIESAELSDAKTCPNGRYVSVAGMVLVRQRPSTASGIVFMTIEDETGTANLILKPKIFDKYRRAARHGVIILAWGAVERDSTSGRVVHVMVRRIEEINQSDTELRPRQRNFH